MRATDWPPCPQVGHPLSHFKAKGVIHPRCVQPPRSATQPQPALPCTDFSIRPVAVGYLANIAITVSPWLLAMQTVLPASSEERDAPANAWLLLGAAALEMANRPGLVRSVPDTFSSPH
ncbi:hypothetical protein HaLaN_26885 [Haematococcus lacustris]|uniref:Uncharacterized protein n=1 Tax=Haematococcus lacustris TaxID=44745 RepID=A0A6A0A7E9_HAELA|nr:hypothetical protein HaLaN_26885 [Haematococcus lacustris]